MEKCKNCGGKIDFVRGVWNHQPGSNVMVCGNGEPGMGLIELIQWYYDHSFEYATWARPANAYTPNAKGYTKNSILHGLRMQATIHWNNCTNNNCKGCEGVGKDFANSYMKELANGRHDLHPSDDNDVHMMAFDIHNATGHGRPGIMTCPYVVGPKNYPCDCYEVAYQKWLQQGVTRADMELREQLSKTPVDLDDLHYEPRFD